MKISRPSTLLLAALLMLPMSVALASGGSESLIQQGTGIGGTFDSNFETIALSFVHIARVVVSIMTCIALGMIMFGIEDGKKSLWNWMLGAGLAVNIGSYLLDVFVMPGTSAAGGGAPAPFVPNLHQADKNAASIDILSQFMIAYMQIINHGAQIIVPISVRILLILAVIEASWELSFKLISGDKIKYLLSFSIKIGFLIFLMENWLDGLGLMNSLSQGFETMGLMMGGTSAAVSPDSIVNNAVKIFFLFWEKASFNSLGLLLVNGIALIGVVVLLFLVSIEMFMARIEFYTLALLVLPLLPFMITSKFSFLSDNAIGAMFNLAIKVMAIAFLTSIIGPMLDGFTDQLKDAKDPWTNIGVLMQVVLVCLILYLLIKKVSGLVSTILNGTPSLGGSGMMDTVRGAAGGAVGAASKGAQMAGNVAGAKFVAREAAAAGNGPQNIAIGTLAQLGKSAIRNNPMTRSYREGMRNIESRNIKEKTSRIKDDIGKSYRNE